MIDRKMGLRTEEQAKKLANELNRMSGVWGACTDGCTVIVTYRNESAQKKGTEKFWEIYDS